MFKKLLERGREHGDPDGCVVCHGGQSSADVAELAHAGTAASLVAAGGPDAFFPDPASPWVNERSCGQCHAELVKTQWRSLMMTEAGKIQGTTWSFGSLEGYQHVWANYPVRNPEAGRRLGSESYVKYMDGKSAAHPNIFVDAHEPLPEAPVGDDLVAELREHPERAVFTYLRNQCQRCHLGVKGRQRRGDFRGMGCGACHIPYSNAGYYEGGDATIPKDVPGHPLVHQIQATRGAKTRVGDVAYSGIPVETCTTCHNRGKRIGVSYQGLMESAYGSPYTEGGGGQIGLHTKHYIAMEQDVHYQRGMLCQDCHTSGDVHGDGFLAGANLAAVEIECSDCHGTPEAFPWELPLGWGDEDAPGARTGSGRGVARDVEQHLKRGSVAPAPDGYLLSARGNAMPDVVREGENVVVRAASGTDLTLVPLKAKYQRNELSPEAEVAMVRVRDHMQNMECYSCHSSWAPQCYGCHVKIDFSADEKIFDWVAAGRKHAEAAHRTDRGEAGYDTYIPGKTTELRSYMRWEDPALGVNGEGRVTPVIPGCQVSVTVIDPEGREVVRNRIFRTQPHSEGAGPEGQLGSDMSPVQPHTVGKARSCESCHGSDKAAGYGIRGARKWDQGTEVDLMTAAGVPIPSKRALQIEPIASLDHDWSALVAPDGEQLQTVGHHFQGSGPLSATQREKLDRKNVCVGCHAQIPDADLAVSALHHMAEMAGQLPTSSQAHSSLLSKLVLLGAWTQVAAPFGVVGGGMLIWWWRRKKA